MFRYGLFCVYQHPINCYQQCYFVSANYKHHIRRNFLHYYPRCIWYYYSESRFISDRFWVFSKYLFNSKNFWNFSNGVTLINLVSSDVINQLTSQSCILLTSNTTDYIQFSSQNGATIAPLTANTTSAYLTIMRLQ